jgi:hypothetical protein
LRTGCATRAFEKPVAVAVATDWYDRDVRYKSKMASTASSSAMKTSATAVTASAGFSIAASRTASASIAASSAGDS